MSHVSQRKEQLCVSHQFTHGETEAQRGEVTYPASPTPTSPTRSPQIPPLPPPSCRWVNRSKKVPLLPKVPWEHGQPSSTPLAPPHVPSLGDFLTGRKQQRLVSQVGGQSLSPGFDLLDLQIASGSNRLRPGEVCCPTGCLLCSGLINLSAQGRQGNPGQRGGQGSGDRVGRGARGLGVHGALIPTEL